MPRAVVSTIHIVRNAVRLDRAPCFLYYLIGQQGARLDGEVWRMHSFAMAVGKASAA